MREISWWKGEPDWMTKFRLKALRTFEAKPMAPWFAVNMPNIDFQDIYYYLKPTEGQVSEWEDLPEQMRITYEKLGIPEAERKYLAGPSHTPVLAAHLVCTTDGDSPSRSDTRDRVSRKRSTRDTVARVLCGALLSDKNLRIRAPAAPSGRTTPVLCARMTQARAPARAVSRWMPVEDLRQATSRFATTPEFGQPCRLLQTSRVEHYPSLSVDLCWFFCVSSR